MCKTAGRLTGTAWKDGNFWLIEIVINGKTCLTQARNLRELQAMADDLAACYGVEDPHVDIRFRDVQFQAAIDAYREASARSREAQEELSVASREAVKLLRSHGASVRETALLLGISGGRVSQLAS